MAKVKYRWTVTCGIEKPEDGGFFTGKQVIPKQGWCNVRHWFALGI